MKIIIAAFLLFIATSFQPSQINEAKSSKVKDGWSESYGNVSKTFTGHC